MKNRAEELANFLLEAEPPPGISKGACVQCEIEHYGKPMSDSHGWCRRHLEAWLRDPRNQMTDEQVREVLSSTHTTPPDLGPAAKPHPERRVIGFDPSQRGTGARQ